MSRSPRAFRSALAALALAVVTAPPASAETTVREYLVELFDQSEMLVASGRLALAFTPVEGVNGAFRVDGEHHFDRASPGAPPVGPSATGVHGQVNRHFVRMSLAVVLLERIEVEARFTDQRFGPLTGTWRYAECFRFARGWIRAIPLADRERTQRRAKPRRRP